MVLAGYTNKIKDIITDIGLSLFVPSFEICNPDFNIKTNNMNLVSIRLITTDVKRLVSFYETVTQMKLVQFTEDFAELRTATATLAIGSTRTLQFFGGDEVAKAAWNKSAIIEFLVQDVDNEFERLRSHPGTEFVQKPTLMPWGNKSLLFRDPDGNLVNLFTPTSAEAIKKFETHSQK